MGGLAADLAEGGIAAADPEDGAALALGVERRRGRGGDGWVACRRVGDARAELESGGRRRRERELDPELGGQVLAVGEQEPVETAGLGRAGGLGDAAGEGEGVEEDLDPGSLCRRRSGVSLGGRAGELAAGGVAVLGDARIRRERRADAEAKRLGGALDVEARADRLASCEPGERGEVVDADAVDRR